MYDKGELFIVPIDTQIINIERIECEHLAAVFDEGDACGGAFRATSRAR